MRLRMFEAKSPILYQGRFSMRIKRLWGFLGRGITQFLLPSTRREGILVGNIRIAV
jgi:hypothetical protein